MKLLPSTRHGGTIASVVALAAIIGTLTVFAIVYPGVAVQKVALNDSGIWVTKDDPSNFGRYNKSARTLDTVISNEKLASFLDIRQDGPAVVVRDEAQLTSIDVRRGTRLADQAIAVPNTSPVEMGGGSLARLDPTTGKVWATRYSDGGTPASVSELQSTAVARGEVGAVPIGTGGVAAAALTVSTSGIVYAVSAKGRLLTLRPLGDGFAAPQYADTGLLSRTVEITSVGDVPVVLDVATGHLWLGGREGSLGTADPSARLQAASPDRSEVIVATQRALLAVPLSGGDARKMMAVDSPGSPAAPVQLGACLFAAWAGTPGVIAQSCGGTPPQPVSVQGVTRLTNPVYRINRGQAVLNDASGLVVDMEILRKVDNWDPLTKTDQQIDTTRKSTEQNLEALRKRKPLARPDDLFARPGRTTVLHVLDNDSDPAGRILTAAPMTQPKGGATVVAAPDGQSLLYTLPNDGATSSFSYRIDNGDGGSDTSTVTVQLRSEDDNEAPHELTGPGILEPDWSVVAGGSLSIPELANWRDKDGDPLSYSKTDANAGSIVTAADRLEFTAPDKAGQVKINYWVTDGRVDPPGAPGTISVNVLAADSDTLRAAVAEPDVVSGVVGQPIVFQPLANDIPGADPGDPDAALGLAGAIAPRSGVTVDTDLKTGKITANATRPGSYLLNYTATYGAAPLSKAGQIRIDVTSPPSNAASPVGVPDEATTHGQQPVIVDVLANDVDPAGSVLSVETASPDDPDQIEVSVLRGRWLRIVPLKALISGSQLVHYQVTNGRSAADRVQVTLTQLPAVEPDPPVTRDDHAVVRAGDTVTIPVLQNDSTVGGAPLSLQTNVAGAPGPGRLQVTDLTAGQEADGDVGAAYASTSTVRYVPPATVPATKTISIDYVAETDLGLSTAGTAYVTVVPADPQVNHAPTPTPLEGRVTAGGTLKLQVPSTGQDPDGDSITVVGITDAPSSGRITGFSPTSISYQAFPTSSGTDSFGFTVTDRYGATASAVARVSVTQPHDSQQPVAVADTVTAAPGATVKISLLSNDLYDSDDSVTVLPLDRANSAVPKGTGLDESSGTLESAVPNGDSQVVSYAIRGSGGAISKAAVTIRSQDDFDNPPIVYDQVATATKTGTAEADVMSQAWDPDGPNSALKLQLVGPVNAQIVGSKIVAQVTASAQVIPYQVTDGGGGTASAVVYVPGTESGPYVKAGQTVQVGVNASTKVALADFVASPRNQPVSITTADRQWASPAAGLRVKAVDSGTLEITSTDDYTGPGAVTLEVTDSPDISDSNGKAVVSIPVQVGPAVPVLRCPTGVLPLVEGGEPLELSISSHCHTWAPDPNQISSLTYTAELVDSVPGVSVAGSGTGTIVVRADSDAKKGDARLQVNVVGSQAKPAELRFAIISPGKPTLSPIRLDGIKQGTAASIDLANYLTSPMDQPVITAVAVEPQGDAAGSSIKAPGGVITITPPSASSGPLSYRLTASDVSDPKRTDRQVQGTIGLQVYGIPDSPRQVRATAKGQSHTASVSWQAGGDNGAPILEYRVKSSSGLTQICAAAPCQIRGLKNGVWVTFTVQARNKAGWSKLSESTNRARPDAVPPAVTGLAASKPADHTLTLTWTAPVPDGTPVKAYRISWPGHVQRVGSQTTFKPTGLDNHNVYTFSVVAINDAGPGKSAATQGQSSGKPSRPSDVKAVGEADPAGATTPVTITWGDSDANGPGPLHYTVIRSGPGGSKTICSDQQSDRCLDGSVIYDGGTYRYGVTGTNKTGGPAHTSAASSDSFLAVGQPDSWGSWSAEATGQTSQVKLSYTVPASRGKTTDVYLVDGGSQGQRLSTSGSDTVTLSNGDTHTLKLRVCNESNNCSTSDARTVTPYGPFQDLSIQGSAGGQDVNYTVTGNANGLDTDVYVNDTKVDTWHGNGSYSGHATPGWDTDYTVDVRASDSKRADQHASKTFHTDGAPLQVTVAKGSPASIQSCTSTACAHVKVSGSNFTPNSQVRISYSTGCETNTAQCESSPPFPTYVVATDGGGNFTKSDNPVFGFPGSTVTATVTNLSNGRQASGTVRW